MRNRLSGMFSTSRVQSTDEPAAGAPVAKFGNALTTDKALYEDNLNTEDRNATVDFLMQNNKSQDMGKNEKLLQSLSARKLSNRRLSSNK